MDLQYGSIKLRAMEPEDANFLFQLLNNPDIEKMVVGKTYSVSEYEENNWIKNFHNSDQCIRWVIEHNDKTRIGTVILNDINWINRTAEIGIKLDINNITRKHGDAKDAYYTTLQYAFDELNLNKITATTLEYNEPSIKLHSTMGFKLEGKLRQAVFKSGNYHNLIIFGLLREEFKRYTDGAAPWQQRT